MNAYPPPMFGFNPLGMAQSEQGLTPHPFLRRLMGLQGGYDSSGINPGGMYTGGNHPAMPMGYPQMSGNDPAHASYPSMSSGYPYGPSMSGSEAMGFRPRHTGTHKFNGFG